jgi:hypothetical protein
MPEKLELIAELEDKTRAKLQEMVRNHKTAVDAIKKNTIEAKKHNQELDKSYAQIRDTIKGLAEGGGIGYGAQDVPPKVSRFNHAGITRGVRAA